MLPVTVRWLGSLDYRETHARMAALVADRAESRASDTLLMVEHPHVITRGRKARDLTNVVAAGELPVVAVERGGDVTYHGPGQLVCYPVFKLRAGERDAPRFIRALEGWVIDAMARLHITDGVRRPPFSGVWCRGKKVASVGVAVTATWVTWHGIAINVSTDLDYFRRINPCGMEAGLMSSLEALEGRPIGIDALRAALVEGIEGALGRRVSLAGSR